MCLQPIYLKNKSKSRFGGLPYIKVPCRKCKECLERMRNDYVIRSIALYNSLPPNYSVYFCTLTFRNEDLPITNVYFRGNNGDWQIKNVNQPTFNHVIFRRFRKNFQEHSLKCYSQKSYILASCEYGEKKHRPHYHAMIFYPKNCDWKEFKSIIERYWHYGFTKNISLVNIDGIKTDRSILNSIKYVCKYVNKHSSRWLPSFLHDNNLCTDFPPSDITPKVFISNGYGDALLHILTKRHFITGKIFMQLKYQKDDRGSEYFIPQYYRRRFFTSTSVINKEVFFERIGDEPYIKNLHYIPFSKLPLDVQENISLPNNDNFIRKYKIKTKINRINGYDKVLFDNFKRQLKVSLFDYNYLLKHSKRFKSYISEVFDDLSISVDYQNQMEKIYLERYAPDSLSPLSPSVARENIIRTHYLFKGIYSQIEKVHLFKNICAQACKHGLPWLPLRSVSFAVSAPVPMRLLPTDYYKIEFAEQYKRCIRQNKNIIQDDVEKEYFDRHILPFNDIE